MKTARFIFEVIWNGAITAVWFLFFVSIIGRVGECERLMQDANGCMIVQSWTDGFPVSLMLFVLFLMPRRYESFEDDSKQHTDT